MAVEWSHSSFTHPFNQSVIDRHQRLPSLSVLLYLRPVGIDQDPEANREVKDFPNILLEQRLDLLDTNPQTLFKLSMFQLCL